MRKLRRANFVVALALASRIVVAQTTDYLPAEDESASFTAEAVLSGLDNPWGMVIRAGRDTSGPHELFVAESGAGRVIRISTDQPDKIQEAIVGFPVHSLASSPAVRVGPLGLAFLTRTKLIVTGGRREDGKQEVRVYVLPGDNSRLAYDEHDHSVGPLRTSDPSKTSAGDLLAIATDETAAFITLGGDSAGGRILKADIEKNRLETLRPFVSHRESNGLAAPAGITFTPSDRPQFLVVAEQGSFLAPHDSRLTFYTVENGRLALSLSTGLHDIMGLTYSPTGQLYAVDCAWHDSVQGTGQGGVYRLDDARQEGRQACQAVKVASVTRGVALAFAPDGALYVTALGDGENAKQGTVIKITGKF